MIRLGAFPHAALSIYRVWWFALMHDVMGVAGWYEGTSEPVFPLPLLNPSATASWRRSDPFEG